MSHLKNSKGSMTVEAAIVLPIFIFFILSVAYIMNFVRTQYVIQSAITQTAMDTAKNAYGEEVAASGLYAGVGSFISTVSTNNTLRDKAGSSFLNNSGIRSGENGVLCITDSLTNSEQVTVRASYAYSLGFNVFGLRPVTIGQRAISRKWTGYKISEGDNDTEVVYIARTGTVYHKTPNCTHINLDIRQVDGASLDGLRNNEGAKYYYCERCSKGLPKTGIFYITGYGDAYHKDGNCSGLKRDISAIPITSVGDRRQCSRCYGAAG